MPGTIGTYRESNGNEVRALALHDGVAIVLVENDGHDPFGGRHIAEEPTAGSADALPAVQADRRLAVAG